MIKNIYVYLKSPDRIFHLTDIVSDLLTRLFEEITVIPVTSRKQLLQDLPGIEYLITWDFKSEWYGLATMLKAVFTPAAGDDWAEEDPEGRVPLYYGHFHGRMIAESLLAAMLYFNRLMPDLLARNRDKMWDRDFQSETTLLCNQKVMLIGYGNIGNECAALLRAIGCTIFGVKRTEVGRVDDKGTVIINPDEMMEIIPECDHIVLILPKDNSTDQFFHREQMVLMKKSACLYNVGRANSLSQNDLIDLLRQGSFYGAWLDVFEEEPLPQDSPLWGMPNVLITPHSSCGYRDYSSLYVHELKNLFRERGLVSSQIL